MAVEFDDLLDARKKDFKCEVNLARRDIYGDEMDLQITLNGNHWIISSLLEDECIEVVKKIAEFWKTRKNRHDSK